jgi:hypothetical protein
MGGEMKRIVMLLSAILILTTCEPTAFSMYYEVRGPADPDVKNTYIRIVVDITYLDENGATQEVLGKTTPWICAFMGHTGQFVDVSAQTYDPDNAVTVSIYKLGKSIITDTSTGPSIPAEASGTL